MADFAPTPRVAVPDSLLPTGWRRIYRTAWYRRLIAREFNRVYYANADRTLFDTAWQDVTTVKYPTDLFIYQELIVEQRPQLIIETGTYSGGSAAYLADVCTLLGEGRVITIDIHDHSPPAHPLVTYMIGSSTSPEILSEVQAAAAGLERVMIILDSDHAASHVLDELRAYADLVHVGGWIVVEDTNVGGHPVLPEHGPGPFEGTEQFLDEDQRFVREARPERLMLTANPGGFLRRIR